LTLFNNNRERSVIITDDIFNHSSNNAAGKISAEIKIPRVTSKQKKKRKSNYEIDSVESYARLSLIIP